MSRLTPAWIRGKVETLEAPAEAAQATSPPESNRRSEMERSAY
ncbi:hypothetical protein [Rossellomorea marisflavi]